METKVLLPTKENIAYAAQLIQKGEIVGMPTETVYGLAANAYNETAVAKIFVAKGRPQDNPLIVHIASMEELSGVASEISETAMRLAKKFWPGPLTMILPKSEKIPLAVTAGLSTVGIRYPSNKVANAFIKECGVPIAAPSANLSGHPSPTTADHVFVDLDGKVPAILDGGPCEFGLESTVILPMNDAVRLLRPGAVTVEMLSAVVSQVIVDKGVLHEVKDGEKAMSPGMLHKHYSPKTNVVLLDGSFEKFRDFIEEHAHENIGAMVFEGEEGTLDVPYVTYGKENDPKIQAKLLFSALRGVDSLHVTTVYARMPVQSGIGLAIYNRLIRAAGFEVIKL